MCQTVFCTDVDPIGEPVELANKRKKKDGI